MAKVMELRVGDAVAIDHGRIVVRLTKTKGARAHVAIDCDRAIRLDKVEHAERASDVLRLAPKGVRT